MNHQIRDARVDTRLALLGAIASLLVAWVLGAAAVANAHTVATYYADTWTDDPVVILGDVSSPLDTSDAETNMRAGRLPWNSAAGSTFDFIDVGTDDSSVTWLGSACATAPEAGGVWLVTTDLGSNFAQSNACQSGGDYVKGATAFDDSPPSWWSWHTGSSSTVPDDELDLRSAAVHEFGHLTGFGAQSATDHFGGGDCSVSSTDQTMCPTYQLEVSYWRTLETHDLHTFADAY